ncbi:hypothetical protein ACFWM3_08705 [Gottfriedia sp. NPDC058432]|nr:hypothetical protein [Bacillus sp. FJAT-25509]
MAISVTDKLQLFAQDIQSLSLNILRVFARDVGLVQRVFKVIN